MVSQSLDSNQCPPTWMIFPSPLSIKYTVTYYLWELLHYNGRTDRDHMAHKVKNIHYEALKEKVCQPQFYGNY